MTPESQTPLTDAAVNESTGFADVVSFARDLELKLTAQTAAAQAMEDALKYVARLFGEGTPLGQRVRAALAQAKEAK